MKASSTQKIGSGCPAMGVLALVCLAALASIVWPAYVDTNGTRTSGVITEKHERIRVEYGEWYRHFEIIAAYSIPGQVLPHRASCNVDEKTYDSLHLGSAVVVHYLANLLNQPFLPATDLSPCSTMASIGLNPSTIGNLLGALIALLAILFLWRILRIRIAVWLLLPWVCLSLGYLLLPKAEPEPRHPVPATATVASLTTVAYLGEGDDSEGIPLQHPYQIVELKFVPSGMDTGVIAIDKVDLDSVPNLKEGQSADIVYDVERPRVARLRAGTRFFPGQALITVILCCAAFTGFLVIAAAVLWVFKLAGRSLRERAASAQTVLRRRRPRI
jgi:hypothetical protein